MRGWMVLARLAMGLGCSEEPPEQWSHPAREDFVQGCASAVEADLASVQMLEDGGYTSWEVCRNILKRLEALYTESDFLLLSLDEAAEVLNQVGYDYGREIGREIGSD